MRVLSVHEAVPTMNSGAPIGIISLPPRQSRQAYNATAYLRSITELYAPSSSDARLGRTISWPITASSNPSQIIRVCEREWEPMSATIKFKSLWSDPASKRRAQMTRFEPGATLPMHRHVGDELLYVIEGAISDESGTAAAGSVGYRPNGCIHSVTSKTGATVFAIISGGIEPANEIGTAPRSQTIVLSDIRVGRCDAGRAAEADLERQGDQAARGRWYASMRARSFRCIAMSATS